MPRKKTKIIVTVGPATSQETDLRKIKQRNVAFIRANMSHSSLAELERFILLSKKVGIPFIIDTEGSQVRTGALEEESVTYSDNKRVRLWSSPVTGNERELSLRPGSILEQLEEGDLLHVDFDTLILRVVDVGSVEQGYITAQVISSGTIGQNKAVVIDPVLPRQFQLPALSEKDYQSVEIGLREGIEWIAVSFVRSGDSVDEIRRLTDGRMKIISKVECLDALENLEEIIAKSDAILIDRGDLSKEIPVEKVPFAQKIVIAKARRLGRPVYVATNLLESMVEKRKPTRAEVYDVVNTIIDGAAGLTLAAETAIGRHPIGCINTLNRLIYHAEMVASATMPRRSDLFIVARLEESGYLLDQHLFSAPLVPPHGGKLVDRIAKTAPTAGDLASLPRVRLDFNRQMDVEQLAIGTYSPLEGFMGEADLECVLDEMRLSSGVVWPLPILLDVPAEKANELDLGGTVALVDERDEPLALLVLEEKYHYDKERLARKLYGTVDRGHPGVQMVTEMQPVFLGGKIELLHRRSSATKAYEQTPRQIRRLFNERGWATVLGFHTRNVIHRVHEYMQLKALEEESCDGLFVHPVIGRKKPGDFHPAYIIRTYEKMLEAFYPEDKVVFAAFATFSRYAGPREALFTALCRKNFGCSHFIVGRDHTGVRDYYEPDASQKIFDMFPDIGIKAVKFNKVYYSPGQQRYLEEVDRLTTIERLEISGSQARSMLASGLEPPSWLMRPEVAAVILEAIRAGEEVFVPE